MGRGKHGKVAEPVLASLGHTRAARTGEARQAGLVWLGHEGMAKGGGKRSGWLG
jgi:hypothetical protein